MTDWLHQTFASPAWLLLLPLLPLVVWAVIRRERSHTGTLRFSIVAQLATLPRGTAARFRRLPLLLRAAALVLLVIALARPQSFDPEDLDVEGLDIVVALDMSGSMQAVDVSDRDLLLLQGAGREPTSRFDAALEVLREFILSRRYDRIGMVVFGAQAYTEFPLTLDYRAIIGILGRLKLGDVDGSATVIGDALGKGLNLLRRSEARTKIVILITDGDNRGGHITPMQAADFASTLDVKVFPILVGTPDQSRVPVGRDLFGDRLVYRPQEFPINPDLLRDLAEKTDGSFYTAADREALERHFHEILDRFEKTRIRDLANALKSELLPWFLLPAFFLLALASLLELTLLRKLP